MSATFAGASRTFFASVIFAYESTHASGSLGPLLLGRGAAVLDSRVLMRETIMTEKLARRGGRIPSDYEPDFFHALSVADVIECDPLTAGPAEPVAELTTHPEAPLSDAVDLIILHGIGRLPVVDHSAAPRRPVQISSDWRIYQSPRLDFSLVGGG